MRYLSVTDWGRVLTVLITTVGSALSAILIYRRWTAKERPVTQMKVQDAGVVRQRQLAEAWAEMVAHTEERLRQAEFALDECRNALRSCEQEHVTAEGEWTRKLLIEQGHVDVLQREVSRLRTQIRKAGT